VCQFQVSGWHSWPTRSSPNQPSTDSSPPPTNSSSKASPTGAARSPDTAPTKTPNHAGHVAVLDAHSASHHHHPADAEDPDMVPCHWRNGGPITLASDIANQQSGPWCGPPALTGSPSIPSRAGTMSWRGHSFSSVAGRDIRERGVITATLLRHLPRP